MNKNIYCFSIIVFICLILGGFSSCNLINPDESIPAYIEVDTFLLTTNVNSQGSASHKIEDIWVYANEKFIGTFPLPARVPIIGVGNQKISLGPGIIINGISANRVSYPFYRLYDEDVVLKEGEISKISPQTTYFEDATFAFLADFNNPAGSNFEQTPLSDTSISLTSDPALVFEGGGSLRAELNRDFGVLEFRMVDPITLPRNGRPIYLEMNFNVSQDVVVFLESYGSSLQTQRQILINLRGTGTWRKMYINMTRQVNDLIFAESHRIVFRAEKPTGSAPVRILLDNIKIIH